MGTEGRKQNPKDEVPPLSEIYEFVQFRATDVTSVQFESDFVQPPPQPLLPQDPAILGSGAQVDKVEEPLPQKVQPPLPSSSEPVHSTKVSETATVARSPKDSLPSNAATENQSLQQQQQQQQHPLLHQSNSNNNSMRNQQARRGRPNDSSYRSQTRKTGYQSNNRSKIPDSDFDFEQSNSKFNKSQLIDEISKLTIGSTAPSSDLASPNLPASQKAPSQVPDLGINDISKKPEDYYNKKKSFFDDISCETKERYSNQNQGLSYKERRERANDERRHNVETFGFPTSINNRRYNRGNSRQNNWNPSYRYNNNNNNNNNNSNNRTNYNDRNEKKNDQTQKQNLIHPKSSASDNQNVVA
ncbi:Protein LSM14-like protein [Smittium mucronatum]|uniref:Protein LSM14-like protein n=1 Tax=Smittium mucronatum TaxID=133383 RepID=A0A1R0GTE5_9FUNG|nr:Protein LSM14-like protein [Smittium mucronatum]